ncbi:MAG: xanthine dehydrogenase family protein molybdopterin-binding subunit [Dehalococcoidia bacterium]
MAVQSPPPYAPKFIGARIKRREDPRLIQGKATYVDDMKLPGMLHLAFKRSDLPHARIRSIDVSAALAMDGVEAVYTGADLADILLPLPAMVPFPAPPRLPIAKDTVRFVGEPYAVVVARDRYIARDAIDAIVADFEPLGVVIDEEKAADPGQPQLHEGFANNIVIAMPSGTGVDLAAGKVDDSAIDAAFAQADVVISQRMMNHRLAPTAIEPRAVLAQWEDGKGQLTVWAATQAPHMYKTMVSGFFKLGEDQVRVVAPEVGGGFGAKMIYGEDYVAIAITRKLGVPVKWIEDRSEAFLTTSHGRGIIGYLELAAKNDGRILGLRAKLLADIGAYEALASAALPTLTAGMLSGVYDIPAIRANIVEVFTNKTPTDAYRGAGRPEGIYFVERAVDMLAAKLGMDPTEVRRKNFIAPSKFPFLTQAGNMYDSGEYAKCLDRALANAGWEALKAERDAAQAAGRLVGLGISFYVEICGIGGWEHASVTVQKDGRVVATTGASSHGQGHETTFAQLLSAQLGVPMELITIQHGDTAVARHGTGTFGSRSQVAGGTAMMNAGEKVRSKMAKFASHLMDANPDDLEFLDGEIRVKGSPGSGKSFAEVAGFAYAGTAVAQAGGSWPAELDAGLSQEAFWEPGGATFPFGCHIAMVEVDRETGELQLLKMLAVDDAGTIVNPLIVEGQVHGGLAQGIGQAMIEEVVYDADGQPITGSFMDYAIPRATDFPWFELDNTVTRSPHTPLGTKGIGEAGTIGSTPCIVNATVDALRGFGVAHIDMMLRPEKLWAIIHGTGGQQ